MVKYNYLTFDTGYRCERVNDIASLRVGKRHAERPISRKGLTL